MRAVVSLLLLYSGCVLLTALAAHGLRRPLPGKLLLTFALVPIALLPGAFLRNRTAVPLDHLSTVVPWSFQASGPPRNPYLNDVALQFLPWTEAVRAAWRSGELPLRDRWNGCGTPLAANGQSAAFSPLTLLGLLLPVGQAFTLAAGLKVFLALTGMWLWTRELGASPPAAFLAAVSFGLSFALIPWLLFPHTAVIALWPWMLLSIELLRDGTGRRASVALVTCFVLMVVGGQPESLAFGCLFAALWLVLRWASGAMTEAPRLLARVAVCGLIAAGLTAWLLIPEVFAIRASNRYVGYAIPEGPPWARLLSARPHAPIWPGGLLAPLLPFAFGEGIESPMVTAPTSFPELSVGSAGLVCVFAALLLLRPGGKRRKEAWVLAAIAAAALGTAVGVWPATELASRVPVLRFVSPLRFLTFLSLALPVLAAFELDRYRSDSDAGRRPWIGAVAIAAVLAAGAAAAFAAHRDAYAAAGGLAFQRTELRIALVLLAALAGAAFLWRHRPGRFAVALGVLAVAALLWRGRHLYATYPADALTARPPLVAFLESREGVFRVAGAGVALIPNTNVLARVEDVRTHDPAERRAYLDFLNATCGYEPNEYHRMLRNPDAPVLDLLNVRYLVAVPGLPAPGLRWAPAYDGPDGTVFENRSVLPRAFAPRRIRFVERVRLEDLASVDDWGALAYVSHPSRRDEEENAVAVSVYREAVNEVSFRAAASDRPGVVFLSLVDDGGWAARDAAGRPLAVYPSNGPFLAVEVPPGEQSVTLRYRPPGFREGLAVAGVTMLAAAAMAARRLGTRTIGEAPVRRV